MANKIKGSFTEDHQHINGSLVNTDVHISGKLSGETGTKDYNKLRNKPSINGEELVGDRTIIEDRTFVYEKNLPSSVWHVKHNLEKYPAVTVVDSAGTEVIGAIDYIDLNNVTLTFVGSFSGKAFFN